MSFPKSQPEVNALLQIWAVKLPAYKTQYGLTDDIINQQLDDSVIYNHLLMARNLLDEDVGEFFAYLKNMHGGDPNAPAAEYPSITLLSLPAPKGVYKQGIEKRNQELYNFLKAHPSRTAESLADLGIGDTAKTVTPVSERKPMLKGKALSDDRVEISFNKQGMKNIKIQRRLDGGDFVDVGEPTFSPWIDETPSVGGKPEKREYRAIYLEKNKPVGQYSDIITIVTTP